jgi:hypothetical protein
LTMRISCRFESYATQAVYSNENEAFCSHS